tara:strand:+ start:5233 stop:6030 length:798 start_codon:yes stop_codon:yes gene_type:complete
MSSIRLSGTSSGYYDLTVPAVAGTNSIDLSNLVVNNTAASLTGPLTVSGSQSQAGLKLNSGDTNTATGGASQIDFGFNGGANYRHNIATRHDSAGIRNNRIDMFVWQNSQNAADNGNRHVASFDGAGVTFPNQPMVRMSLGSHFGLNNVHASAPGGKITGFTVHENIGNHWNNSNSDFTCPVAGVYCVAIFWIKYPASGAAHVDLYKNNSSLPIRWRAPEAGNHYYQAGGSVFVTCATNDILQWNYFGAPGIHDGNGQWGIRLVG